MAEPASISSGIAARYASALFELARDGDALAPLEADVDQLADALGQSADLRSLITSPLYSRDDQAQGIVALSSRMGLSELMTNTLRLMATKRRLFVLPQLVQVLRARLANAKGEMTAEVTAAAPLSDAQADALAATLRDTAGKAVKLKVSVDASLIGGIVVKMGSKMIDTSIRSKLAALQNKMKEVG